MNTESQNNYTRIWMRDCLNFWMRQYREVKHGDSVEVRRLTYEQACVMTAGADCKLLFMSTPYWCDEPYKETEVLKLFQSEFSEGYQLCLSKYGTHTYKIIPNYKPI